MWITIQDMCQRIDILYSGIHLLDDQKAKKQIFQWFLDQNLSQLNPLVEVLVHLLFEGIKVFLLKLCLIQIT